MKKKLGALLRVVVSVGILAYLFHGIFKKEALDYFQSHNIDPDTLQWSARAKIIWSVGPQVLWEAVRGKVKCTLAHGGGDHGGTTG